MEKYIGTKNTPFIGITNHYRVIDQRLARMPQGTEGIGRGMGFIIKQITNRVVIACSVAHNFNPQIHGMNQGKDYYKKTFCSATQDWKNNMLDLKSEIIQPDENLDLTFFKLKAKSKIKIPELNIPESDLIIRKEKPVTYVKSCVFTNPHEPFYHTRQQAETREDLVAYANYKDKGGELVNSENAEKCKQLEEEGYQKYPIAFLQSMPGFSGSPIIDDDLNLYGIGSRGVGNHNIELMYVPVSVIREKLEEVLPKLINT